MGTSLSDCSNSLFTKEENDLSAGYFNSIRKVQEKSYIDNLSNSRNVAISLDKKGFTTIITSTKRVVQINENIKIDWLQFTYYFLYKQIGKRVPWAQPMLKDFENEVFVYENEFQSYFFFREFEIVTKTPPIKKAMAQMEEESIPMLQYQKRRNRSVTKHFGGSFHSENIPQVTNGEDPSVEYQFFRQRVKEYVQVFNHQVQDPDHPINIVTSIFCEHFADYVQLVISHLKQAFNEMAKNDYQEKLFNETKAVTGQLQKIILKLQIMLKLFYATTVDYQCFSEERDEIINVITTLVFNHDCIYNSIFELYQLSEESQVRLLEEKYLHYKSIRPDELNINVKFRLDLSTLQYQKELLNQKKARKKLKTEEKPVSSLEAKEILKGIEEKMEMPSSSYSLNLGFSMDEDIKPIKESNKDITIEINRNQPKSKPINSGNMSKLEQLEKKKSNLPLKGYNSAIKLFDTIKSVNTPFEKMLIISRISEKITSSVNLFWRDMMSVISPDFLSIEVDTLMELFIYILFKSQMTELPIHMQMIKHFTSNTTKTSTIGYYYTTLDAAIDYIKTSFLIDKNTISIND